MRVIIQRVQEASIHIDKKQHCRIDKGLVVLAGFEDSDTPEDINWVCKKITQLRIFDDPNGVMNLSIADISGEILVVSQFTLHAQTKKGNRPSYIKSAKPEKAIPLYEHLIEVFKATLDGKVATGKFGANMQVSLINDGPVTIFIDSKKKE